MSKQKESTKERLARMQREKEEAKPEKDTELVKQLTHEDDGQPDFSDIVSQLEQRKELEAKGENEGYAKMTVYVREDIYRAFNALITKRGQQKEFCNEALADFVMKKTRELGLNK